MHRLFWNSQEHRTSALWRLLIHAVLFLFLYVIIIVAAFWPLGLITSEDVNLSPWQIFLRLAIFHVVMVASVLSVSRLLDRRKYRNLGLQFSLHWCLDLVFGLALGASAICIYFLVEYGSGWIVVISTFWSATPSSPFAVEIIRPLLTWAVVAISEELLCRGFYLKNIAEGLRWTGPKYSILLAVVVSSVAFALLHIINYKIPIPDLIIIFFIGIVLAVSRVWTGNLALAIGYHFAYNFFYSNVFGYKTGYSTGEMTSVLMTIRHSFGCHIYSEPRYSLSFVLLLCIIVCSCVVVLLWSRWRNGKWGTANDLTIPDLIPLCALKK